MSDELDDSELMKHALSLVDDERVRVALTESAIDLMLTLTKTFEVVAQVMSGSTDAPKS